MRFQPLSTSPLPSAAGRELRAPALPSPCCRRREPRASAAARAPSPRQITPLEDRWRFPKLPAGVVALEAGFIHPALEEKERISRYAVCGWFFPNREFLLGCRRLSDSRAGFLNCSEWCSSAAVPPQSLQMLPRIIES